MSRERSERAPSSTGRRGVGALAAAVGALASIALVGLVLTPNDLSTSEPTVAAEGAEEVDQDAETETEPSDPAEEDPAPEADPVTEDEPLAEEEPVTTQEATPEPTEEPSPAPTEAPDLSTYEELDERTLAQIVKAPDDHLGRQVIVYGAITQLDAATGKGFVRISIAEAPQGSVGTGTTPPSTVRCRTSSSMPTIHNPHVLELVFRYTVVSWPT